MTSGRVDPMAGLDDLSDFQPKPAALPKKPKAAVREASEHHNFPSRAANSPSPPARTQRRRRPTGRTEQINFKVKPEISKRFTALADAAEMSLVETFEQAVIALEEKHARS